MAEPPANGYLLGFEDGPLAQGGNVQTLAGATGHGRFVVPRELFGWPLPDRVRALAHPGLASNCAIWDADAPPPEGLPSEIVDSPNAVTYRKISESQMDERADAPGSRVMRGAAYELERP